jgi:hypothetical protein
MFTSNSVMRSLTEALGAGQADAALVREEFADGTDTAGTEVIDIIEHALAAAELGEILDGSDEILGGDHALAENRPSWRASR